MVVLSVEGVLAKAVDSFFAEKKFDHRESHIEGNAAQGEDEDAPAIINADEEEEQAQVQNRNSWMDYALHVHVPFSTTHISTQNY